MVHRIEIVSKVSDARAQIKKKQIKEFGFGVENVQVADVYTIDIKDDFSQEQLEKIAQMLTNPVIQDYKINDVVDVGDFDWVIEIGFLPGVTDNVAHTAQECVQDMFDTEFDKSIVFSSQMILIKGEFKTEDVQEIAENLANKVIQRIHIKNKQEYEKDKGMDCFVPNVKLRELKSGSGVEIVNLEVGDEELVNIGKQGILGKNNVRRGPLALDLESMKEIKNYFIKKEKRMPTDIELESIAQTWSEHCKHTIFASELDEVKEGIYKTYIKSATNKIRAERGDKDFCISVFEDNSGAIVFDEYYMITDKVETHNSPSALDPFGGAITGIVGVNRDTIGFGKGAMPILNRYGFCFGYPEDKSILFRGKDKTNPALSSKRIMQGVIEGVNVGGNCSGIPTSQGFMYFDKSYKGKPLVFVGTLGLMPRKVAGKESHVKKAQPGDCIVVIGGRVGKDGIHGATFSSEAMDSGSPATAVQIGDPITQKKLSDVVVKEARGLDLYTSITDNGAGGLSCSVAEMAKECGGFVVELEKVPVKYSGIQPWEIWISESQERMTLSVSKDKIDDFLKLMKKRGVEATVIGEFYKNNRAIVNYNSEKILDINMDFLHEGIPKKILESTFSVPKYEEPVFDCAKDLTFDLLQMLSRHNIASFEFVSRQYDHEVQAGSVLKPLQGIGEVNSSVSVTKPLYESDKAIVTSQGITAKYSQIDTYNMAACAIDTAVRNVVAAGGDINHLALLDNFCWCSSNDAERLGQLKLAAKACHDYALVYKTPFISGKDSMFNDFKGYDENNNALKISVLPTLLVSSVGVVDDYQKAVSLDVKFPGDLIYVLGETKNELGASEYYEYVGEKLKNQPYVGNKIPEVNSQKAYEFYKCFNQAINKKIIASSISVDRGGLGVALAKMCVAGKLGANINFEKLNKSSDISRDDFVLFSESQSRIIVTVAPENQQEFEKVFAVVGFSKIGEISESQFVVRGISGHKIIEASVGELNEAYKKRFGGY